MTPGLMTQSILMDGKKHIRTFQNKGTDYRDIIDIIIENYNNSAFIMTSKVIMDIESMQNQLFFERSKEFLKE